MPEYTKRMLRALESTIFAYEKAIVFLEEGGGETVIAKKWLGYGSKTACRLCVAVGARWERGVWINPKCSMCILWEKKPFCLPCYDETLENLSGSIRDLGEPLLNCLKARLKWILKRVEKNGYILE